jgi:hypothetical protein
MSDKDCGGGRLVIPMASGGGEGGTRPVWALVSTWASDLMYSTAYAGGGELGSLGSLGSRSTSSSGSTIGRWDRNL